MKRGIACWSSVLAFAATSSLGAPPNDSCSAPIPLMSGVPANFDSTTATAADAAPACVGVSRDVWYTFTAIEPGTLSLSTCSSGGGFDSVIAVYDGACGALVSPIACNDDSCGVLSNTSAAVLAGKTYLIRVGSFGDTAGSATGRIAATFVTLGAGTFTYQGHIHDGGVPVNGRVDLRFELFDSSSGGAALASSVVRGIDAVEGLVTAYINLPVGITASDTWLEIGVATPVGGNTFTILTPRQPITAAPVAAAVAPDSVDGAGLASDSSGLFKVSGGRLSVSGADVVATGEVVADNFEYTAPVTSYAVVSPISFLSILADNLNIGNSFGTVYVTSGGSVPIVAPVRLPHGATVTEMIVYYLDSEGGPVVGTDLSISLVRRPLTTGSSSTLLTATSSGAVGGVRTLTFAANILVDNAANAYSLRAFPVGGSWSLIETFGITGVRFKYTMPRPVP
ncbi:MAG: hypothetical protein ACKVS8_10265 [Phycisphaerales bacterium]